MIFGFYFGGTLHSTLGEADEFVFDCLTYNILLKVHFCARIVEYRQVAVHLKPGSTLVFLHFKKHFFFFSKWNIGPLLN